MSEFYDQFVEKSAKFERDSRCRIPTEDNLVKHLFEDKKERLEEYASSAHPYMHKKVVKASCQFLRYKKEHGLPKEKDLYKDMSLLQFLNRFIVNRPLVFFNSCDSYTLRNGQQGMGWDPLSGDGHSQPDITGYMTYDELKLSALMQAGVKSIFINSGGRYNQGRKDTSSNFINDGIILGAVGARFEAPGRMEWEECIVSDRNSEKHGYGVGTSKEHKYRKIWANLYGEEHLALKANATDPSRYVKVMSHFSLDKTVFEKRIILLAELLLFEANHRAGEVNKKAYVHVVGFGLGVWQVCDAQTDAFGSAFLKVLNKYEFAHIGVVHFSWIRDLEIKETSIKGIDLIVQNRDPGDLLPEKYRSDHLLVVSYAWDGNSFPGNEYWKGPSYLTASGDPAAAAYSLIPELLNPEINDYYSVKRLRIIDPDNENDKVIQGEEAVQALLDQIQLEVEQQDQDNQNPPTPSPISS